MKLFKLFVVFAFMIALFIAPTAYAVALDNTASMEVTFNFINENTAMNITQGAGNEIVVTLNQDIVVSMKRIAGLTTEQDNFSADNAALNISDAVENIVMANPADTLTQLLGGGLKYPCLAVIDNDVLNSSIRSNDGCEDVQIAQNEDYTHYMKMAVIIDEGSCVLKMPPTNNAASHDVILTSGPGLGQGPLV